MSSDPVPLAAIYDASADGRSLVSAANFAAMRALLDLSTFYASIGHNHSGVYSPVGHTHAQSDITNLATDLAGKQATLVSGTNLKTINSTSLLGSGDIAVSASPAGSSGQVQYNNAGAFGGMTAVVYAGTGTHVAITAQAAATIPLCLKGAASQTGPYLETQTSAGTRKVWIDPSTGAQGTDGRLRHGSLAAYVGWDATDWVVLSGGNGTLCYHAFLWGTSVSSRLRIDGTITLVSLGADSAFNGTLYNKSGALYWRGGSGTITKLADA